MITPQQLLTTAIAAARAAGNLIETMAAAGIHSKSKGFRDVVTEADIAAQQLIVTSIRDRFPEHGFLAEEDDAGLSADAETIWIIDPIDGTSNYSRQIPIYCVSIAAAVKGEIVAGAVYDPNRDQLFAATKNGGATLNGKPIHVSHTDQLNSASISYDWGRGAAERTKMLAMLSTLLHQANTVRCVGSAALVTCWIAAGVVDTYINQNLSAWDWAAAGLILQEAGGTITDHSNQPLQISTKKMTALATNQQLHQQLLPYLKHLQ